MNEDNRFVQQSYSSSEHLSTIFLVNMNNNLRLNQIFYKQNLRCLEGIQQENRKRKRQIGRLNINTHNGRLLCN